MRFHERRGKEPRDVPDNVHEVLRRYRVGDKVLQQLSAVLLT